ncbi:MAG TPA: hypothetical protein VLA88_02100 [Candidatus Saccharimonadales bacterium]|nr:hypothetical protein [Candidatus Saccharimonadales bacterium]
MADEWWAQYGDGLHDLGELAAVLWEVVLHRGHVVVRILKGFVVNDAIVAEALAALPELRERIAAATNAEPLNPVALREFLRELMSLGRVDP